MDNLHYSKLHNRPPGNYASKQDMVDWLWTTGYLAVISMKKRILYFSNEKRKPTRPDKVYMTDHDFNAHNHSYMVFSCTCDIHPNESAWEKLKNIMIKMFWGT
jgi:hypothetical protein